MKWVLIILGVLVGLLALAALAGALLPKGHVATRMARFKQPPEVLWQAITDYEKFSSWRADITKVERLPDRNGWREVRKNGMALPLEISEAVAPRRLVTRIADPKLPFGGTWTYEITAADSGATLRITERGEVYNPIFRLISRWTDMSAPIKEYFAALGKKFGEPIEVVE